MLQYDVTKMTRRWMRPMSPRTELIQPIGETNLGVVSEENLGVPTCCADC